MRSGLKRKSMVAFIGLAFVVGGASGCCARKSKAHDGMMAKVEAAANKAEDAANKASAAARSAAESAQRAERAAQKAESAFEHSMKK